MLKPQAVFRADAGFRRAVLGTAIAAALLIAGCRVGGRQPPASARLAHLPHIVLWAWERREDLSFIDPSRTAVAYLASTLNLRGDEVTARPRFQPLTVPSRTILIAVVRIEVDRHVPPTFSPAQCAVAAQMIAGFASRRAAAIQIDFDATRSQRPFYAALISDLRRRIPQSMPISITALASWCLDDDWLSALPIDEAVPMLYRMGPERREIVTYLRAGREFTPRVGRISVGLSLDSDLDGLATGKRLYLFSPRPWSADAFRAAMESISK